MTDIAQEQKARGPLFVLVWCSWACVAWFFLGWGILKAPFSVPSFLVILAQLSGAVVGLGGLLALAFLIFVARDRSALANGAASLIASTGLLVFFVKSLP
jgi:hypothetical protein